MAIIKTSVLLAVCFSLLSSVQGFDGVTRSLDKRSPYLEGRQTCAKHGYIPACPTGLPCVPPGAICCSDGRTFVMPPNSCPDGTNPVATAVPGGYSTTGSGSSPISTPSSSPITPTTTPSSLPSTSTGASTPAGTGTAPSSTTSSPPLFTGAASTVRAGLVVLVPAALGAMML